jgi:uncharacterized protein YprB with RNaseH-like and TPR domain
MRIENSFIPASGIGEKIEKKYWKKGITHWDHVEDSSDLTDKRKEKLMNFISKARKNLEVNNEAFFKQKFPKKELWRTYRNFEEDVAFFDIETTGLKPDRNKVTTVSIHRGNETKTMIRGQDLTREKLEQEFFEASMIVSFNGKRFDQPFLEKSFDMQIENPHLDLMYTCKRLGYSGGLKKIEKELNIDRELEDLDGREAIRLWKRYENEDDEEALRKLVEYNQYDTVNLRELLERTHKQLRRDIFEPYVEKRE